MIKKHYQFTYTLESGEKLTPPSVECYTSSEAMIIALDKCPENAKITSFERLDK